MKNKLKNHIIKMLSENLECFHPEYKDSFMCPTCLRLYKIKDLGLISEAHIIPKAAGGNLKTYLCKRCNNNFGAKQDKWFGEILRLLNNNKNSPLATAIKDGYFFIDDIKVNGLWEEDIDNGLTFFIHDNKNSPEVNKIINDKFRYRPSQVNFKVPLPILKNQKLIDVGFLTAAYLMWFGLLGYSWVFQDHLETIRQQILNPNDNIIESKYLFNFDQVNWKPWIGLVLLFGDTVPAFGINNHMVVLPPRYKPAYYDSLEIKNNINLSDIKTLRLPKEPFYGPPVSILFENQLVVFAKPSDNALKHCHTILFTKDSNQGRLMKYVDEKTSNEIKQLKNTININIKVPPA